MGSDAPERSSKGWVVLFRSKYLYATLVAMYLLSPKILTRTVLYDDVYPTREYIEIESISSAYQLNDGNLKVCFRTSNPDFGVGGNAQMTIPLTLALNTQSERNLAVQSKEIPRGQFNDYALPQSSVLPGCDEEGINGAVDIANERVDMFDVNVPHKGASRGELKLTNEGNVITYVSSSPIIRVTFMATANVPKQVKDIYYVNFRIIPPERRINWLHCWKLVPAILGDSVMGPFAWVLFLA